MSDPLNSPHIPPALREALRFSPQNAPLLAHVADTLLKHAAYDEAAALFKQALQIEPANLAAKLGLASAFARLGKPGPALVIIEDLVKQPSPAPAALLIHAHLALQAGEPRLAARQYQAALAIEPALADPDLDAELANYLPARPKLSPPAKPTPTAPSEAAANEDDAEQDYPFGDSPDSERERVPTGDLPPETPTADIERPDVDFSHVGGMDTVKQEIRLKIILPLQQPELYKAYGKKIGGGILMYGPPGCGKTHLARATAGEVKAGFLSIGISDVLDMWIGQSEKNLHALFEQARSHRPSVLFFDEVDALGANRTDMLKSGGRHLINQFLSELDGVQSSNEGVLILAATNAPWHLDPAFRRPGRFDRIVFVPPPDAPARAAIVRLLVKGKPVDAIDFEAIAKKTEGFSGADLKAVVDLAVETKLTEAMKTGAIQPLATRDLLETAKRHKPTVRDWFETARNHALYSNQSGLYDDILTYLKIKK